MKEKLNGNRGSLLVNERRWARKKEAKKRFFFDQKMGDLKSRNEVCANGHTQKLQNFAKLKEDCEKIQKVF